jgi:Polymerase beta, Nucleotidyltransferase
MNPANPELEALAEIIAQWVDPVPGVPAVYLFGSRVRGDHRPDSDVDVRVYPEEWTYDPEGKLVQWWTSQNETEFGKLQKLLPGRLHLGRDRRDWDNEVDEAIRAARNHPPVLVLRKVVCLRTPPRPTAEGAAYSNDS